MFNIPQICGILDIPSLSRYMLLIKDVMVSNTHIQSFNEHILSSTTSGHGIINKPREYIAATSKLRSYMSANELRSYTERAIGSV